MANTAYCSHAMSQQRLRERADALIDELDDVSGVSDVRRGISSGTVRIETTKSSTLTPELMEVLADHGATVGRGSDVWIVVC